jgi:hypothetical protein
MADVMGIADKSVTSLQLCTAIGLIETHQGPLIGIFNHYAHYGKVNCSLSEPNAAIWSQN